MTERTRRMIDGNEAAASIAHRTNEVIAIYPITPASPMGELSDEWSSRGRKNLWGIVPDVVELQSEGGAAGTCHGSLQAGALTTTFTASQGLLLMIPNLYKIAGELTSFALHVAARSLATHALSIFGDHSDVMAARQTGLALLCSGSVQEAHDLAAVAQAATLKARVPFLHFFDGFRTSHEIAKIELLPDDDLRALLDEEAIRAHRERGLTPDRPVIRGTAQNPDAFFQAREAANPFYLECPPIVRETMAELGKLTGRTYDLFETYGHPQAERVIVMMGSGAETAHETVDALTAAGEKVALVKVRLYRPFDVDAFLAALPATTKRIAVLDRTKEPGAVAEPLHLDVVTALEEGFASGRAPMAERPGVVGGRYGLSSKEFDPAMVKAVFDELSADTPRRRFTVGIRDDVTNLSLTPDANFDTEPDDVVRAVFYGLGSDGTVGANKNTIKIIGEETDHHAQGYFVYDSKKAGAVTVSHLRFGPRPIRSSYLIKRAGFVACHQFEFLDRIDVLQHASRGARFLLNAPHPPDEVWDRLPREVQQTILDKELELWTIDALAVAREAGLGVRINTIMQTCFFAISGVLPRDEAIERIKNAIEKTYAKRGSVVVRQNFEAVDRALENLHRVAVPAQVTAQAGRPPIVSEEAPDFVQRITAKLLAGEGDQLPVSAFPPDGTWPAATSRWEKRNLAQEIPIWESDLCIQCNRCALACPHAAIRAKAYDGEAAAGAPDGFRSVPLRGGSPGQAYTLQVAPEDCTGCNLCVEVCPAKDKANPRRKAINMEPQREHREREREAYSFFLDLPAIRPPEEKMDAKRSQLLEPLFEYSGACAGCGETPYLKLLSQMFGDRLLIANATGCSSIYGGNLPTTPWAVNRDGRGPAWSNSLFEDNAEFGFGFRLATDAARWQAEGLLRQLNEVAGERLVDELLHADQRDSAGIEMQRERVKALRVALADRADEPSRRLADLADHFVKKSIWIVGGDGWAYDIGYGGLDHVLSQNRDVNVLVLDTGVYSNTGGQQSKATPLGAAAKFAASGKDVARKDLGMEAMSYGRAYVAQIAFGSNMNQTVNALREADSYQGPSLVIAYSHCIAHGFDLRFGARQQDLAVKTGLWPLFRFDPRRSGGGVAPLKLDSREPKVPLREFMRNETRFRMVEKMNPKRFRLLTEMAQREVSQRFSIYQQLAEVTVPDVAPGTETAGNGSE